MFNFSLVCFCLQAMPSFFTVALGYPSDPLLLWILFGILAIYLAFLKRRGRALGQECERLSQQLKQETRSIQVRPGVAAATVVICFGVCVPVFFCEFWSFGKSLWT